MLGNLLFRLALCYISLLFLHAGSDWLSVKHTILGAICSMGMGFFALTSCAPPANLTEQPKPARLHFAGDSTVPATLPATTAAPTAVAENLPAAAPSVLASSEAAPAPDAPVISVVAQSKDESAAATTPLPQAVPQLSANRQIFCLHDWNDGADQIFQGKKGWIMESRLVSENNSPESFAAERLRGHDILLRLNLSYSENPGSIPKGDCTEFANQIGAIVGGLRGVVSHFIIGNETNATNEGGISASQYASCFNLVAQRMYAANPDSLALVAAIGPWNPTTPGTGPYPQAFDNYLHQIALETRQYARGYALHTAGGRNGDANPLDDNWWGFNNYQTQIDVISKASPENATKPIFISEFTPWADGFVDDANGQHVPRFPYPQGFIPLAYQGVNDWNRANGCRIKAMCWFRFSGGYGWDPFTPAVAGALPDYISAVRDHDYFADSCQ